MDCVVGLGSNLGSRLATLRAAVALLSACDGVEVLAQSPVYRSPAVGPPQPDYDNAALRLRTTLSPRQLLGELHAVERALGRERRERWGARTLDLDLLWAPQSVTEADLTVPHARLQERWFALAPLLDVAPELHATYGATLRALGGAQGSARSLVREPAASAAGATASSDGSLAIEGRGDCVEDALAEAIVAMGAALGACGIGEALVVHGADAQQQLRGVLDAAAQGLVPTQAALPPLGQGPGRYFGARGRGPLQIRECGCSVRVRGGEHVVVLHLSRR